MRRPRTLALVMLWPVLVLAGLVSGCRAPAGAPAQSALQRIGERFEYARVVMGSRARVVLYAPDEVSAARAAAAALDEIDRLNAVLSDYDPASEAMRLCALPPGRWHDASPELVDVLEKSERVWLASGGAFDPTVGPLTRLWREARRSGAAPSAEEVQAAGERVGMELVRIDRRRARILLRADRMILDFGGIGKGYAADAALRVLRERGYRSALVDIGGDMAIGDAPPGEPGWRIRAETGDETDELVLCRCGVATSGDRFRFVEIDGDRRSHILDPRPPHTGLGITRRVGVTAVADEAWLADALASAASVLDGPAAHRAAAAFERARLIIIEAE